MTKEQYLAKKSKDWDDVLEALTVDVPLYFLLPEFDIEHFFKVYEGIGMKKKLVKKVLKAHFTIH